MIIYKTDEILKISMIAAEGWWAEFNMIDLSGTYILPVIAFNAVTTKSAHGEISNYVNTMCIMSDGLNMDDAADDPHFIRMFYDKSISEKWRFNDE